MTPRAEAATPVSVQTALANIMADMPAIGKDQQMGSGQYGYAYRGIEQITQHLQPLLAKHGVVIAPRATLISVQPALDAKPGWQDTILSVEWLVVGPDDSTLTASTVGIGRDNSDKGANKAQSQAFKYLLLHLFCISDSKDDADGIPNNSHDEPDPILELFELVKATKDTDKETPLRELAERCERTLSPKAFAEDPDWAQVVRSFLTGETSE